MERANLASNDGERTTLRRALDMLARSVTHSENTDPF